MRLPRRAPGRFARSYRLYHLLWIGLDLILPPRCAGCGKQGSRWCSVCQSQVRYPAKPLCRVCGLSLDGTAPICPDCRRARPRFHALRSWSTFAGPVRRALHNLKYHSDIGFGEALTPTLSEYAAGLQWPVDLIIPVPLGKGRQNERGYNQVGLIARPLSMALGLAYGPGALTRSLETRSQVGLTKAERYDNVRDAFRAVRRKVSGRTILLIDDVATTGATLSSCADSLFASGAQDVFALTVARANHARGAADA